MKLTDIRIHLCPGPHSDWQPNGPGASPPDSMSPPAGGHRLRAFCSLTFDATFVVRDVKLIEGHGGLFLAMPSRKLCDHCHACGEKNHLRARYCNGCGLRLDEDRALRAANDRAVVAGAAATSGPRLKLHADVAHPINARCRHQLEEQVCLAYWREVDRSKQPGYVPLPLDGEDFDSVDARHGPAGELPDPQPPYVPVRSAFNH